MPYKNVLIQTLYRQIKGFHAEKILNETRQVTLSGEQLGQSLLPQLSFFDKEQWANGIVVVRPQDKGIYGPDIRTEALGFSHSFFQAAEALVNEQNIAPETQKKLLKALQLRKEAFDNEIGSLERTQGNAFEPNSSPTNRDFFKAFNLADVLRRDLIAEVCLILESESIVEARKKLHEKGHQLRSQSRQPIFSYWTERDKYNNDITCFILYEPRGRYTSEQIAAKKSKGEKVTSRIHATTSHLKTGEAATANFIRVTVGTIDSNERVTILYQDYRHGTLTPYKDYQKLRFPARLFRSTIPDKRSAIQATTIRNQKEVLVAIALDQAQEQIGSFDDKQVTKILEQSEIRFGQSDNARKRQLLMGNLPTVLPILFNEENPLVISESYMQLVSPGQPFDSLLGEFQYQQYADTLNAFDTYDGSIIPAKLTPQSPEFYIKVNASVMDLGVNWWRNGLWQSSQQIQENRRAFNRLYNGVAEFFKKSIESFNIHTLNKNLLQKYLYLNEKILSEIADLEMPAVKKNKQMLYKAYQRLERERYKNWKKHRKLAEEIVNDLNILRKAAAKDINLSQTYVKTCNVFLQFSHALDLYYSNAYRKKSNNFKLQSLFISLSEFLGVNPASGCKSNNDRGQELANITATNRLWANLHNEGLYDPECYKKAEWLAIYERVSEFGPGHIHNRQNLGVGGPKFKGDSPGKKSNYNYDLWSKIATWSTLKDKSLKRYQRIAKHSAFALLAGVILYVLGVLLTASIVGAHIGVPLLISAKIVILASLGTLFYTGFAAAVKCISEMIKNTRRTKSAESFLIKALAEVSNHDAKQPPKNTSYLIQNLGGAGNSNTNNPPLEAQFIDITPPDLDRQLGNINELLNELSREPSVENTNEENTNTENRIY